MLVRKKYQGNTICVQNPDLPQLGVDVFLLTHSVESYSLPLLITYTKHIAT